MFLLHRVPRLRRSHKRDALRMLRVFPQRLDGRPPDSARPVRQIHSKVEVATSARDIAYSDCRHPDPVVCSPTPEEDVRSRDFTNQMACSCAMREGGGGGWCSLLIPRILRRPPTISCRIIRAIGDPPAVFGRDKLRIFAPSALPDAFGYPLTQELPAIQNPQMKSRIVFRRNASGNLPNYSPKAPPSLV